MTDIDGDFYEEENVRNLIRATSGGADGSGREEFVVAKYQEAIPDALYEGGSSASAVIRTDPQPYIIVDCVNEKTLSTTDFNNVLLSITSLGCFYTESLPTGESNLAVPKNMFKRRGGGVGGMDLRPQGS